MKTKPLTLYLNFEEAEPEHTMKLDMRAAAGLQVHEALRRFAEGYSSVGVLSCNPARLQLSTGAGRVLGHGATLPCGLPHGTDLFVTRLAAGAPSAAMPAGAPAAAAHVYAKEGSAIAASQEKMGENSYYYSVGKHTAQQSAAAPKAHPGANAAPPPPREPAMTTAVQKGKLAEATIRSYSFMDDDAVAKVYVPIAGVNTLPAGAITCDFRDRSFDLRVRTYSSCHRDQGVDKGTSSRST